MHDNLNRRGHTVGLTTCVGHTNARSAQHAHRLGLLVERSAACVRPFHVLHELDRVGEAELAERAGFSRRPRPTSPAVAMRKLGMGYELRDVLKACAAGRTLLCRRRGRGPGPSSRRQVSCTDTGLARSDRQPGLATRGPGGLTLGRQPVCTLILGCCRSPCSTGAAEESGECSGDPALRRRSRSRAARRMCSCPAVCQGCTGVVGGQSVG